MDRFDVLYKKHVVKKLQEEFNYKNHMEIPKLVKICINMGVGDAVKDSKVINNAVNDLTQISGQKPVICNAKKANAAFKTREGMPIGCKVTLRGKRMYEFLERLILVALPRCRELRPFTVKNCDGRGNFSFGIKEQIVFPEINYDKIDTIRGMDITVVTTAKTDKEAKSLLSGMHFPFN
ncbi:MAG: 50S ribosomal protein L5 [Pseudomonadota bacterium]